MFGRSVQFRLLVALPSRIIFGWAVCFCAGCALVQSPVERAYSIAAEAGFVAVDIADTGLKAFVKTPRSPAAARLTVYIESDGAPWPWPDEPPVDPTPLKPLVVGLAAADPGVAVAYLSRPCQYLSDRELANCDPALWTKGRFRGDAVAATTRAVEVLKQLTGASSVNLVGYSGGGAMAALVAARRGDVKCLVTVASPLDTSAWTDSIGVSRLQGSLNPADFALSLLGVPQTHFRGIRDQTVPPRSAARFLSAVHNARVIDRADFDHECCWLRDWPTLYRQSCLIG